MRLERRRLGEFGEEAEPAMQRLTEAYRLQGWCGDDFSSLEKVRRLAVYQRHEFIKGVVDQDSGVFALVQGGVELYQLSASGKKSTIQYCRRLGDIFDLGSFAGPTSEDIFAEVLIDDTIVCGVTWPDLRDIALAHPRVSFALAMTEQTQKVQREHALAERCLYTIKQRLAHKLAELGDEAPDSVVVVSRAELAEMIGAAPSKVTEALQQLRDEGLVHFLDRKPRHIVLLDGAALAKYGK